MVQLDEKLINKLPDTFYDNLSSLIFDGKYHTPKSINNSLRELDEIFEKTFELKFPCSNKIYELTGEVRYSSIVKRKVYREHVIPVESRIIESKKLLIHKKYDKLKLYEYLLNTLYLVYKDETYEPDGDFDSEKYIREDLRLKDRINYFHTNKI
jgi:hypothetical protein